MLNNMNYKYLIWIELIIICFIIIGFCKVEMIRDRVYEGEIYQIQSSLEEYVDSVQMFVIDKNIQSLMIIFEKSGRLRWAIRKWPFEWEFGYKLDSVLDYEYQQKLKEFDAKIFEAITFDKFTIQNIDNEEVENLINEVKEFQDELDEFTKDVEDIHREVRKFSILDFLRERAKKFNIDAK